MGSDRSAWFDLCLIVMEDEVQTHRAWGQCPHGSFCTSVIRLDEGENRIRCSHSDQLEPSDEQIHDHQGIDPELVDEDTVSEVIDAELSDSEMEIQSSGPGQSSGTRAHFSHEFQIEHPLDEALISASLGGRRRSNDHEAGPSTKRPRTQLDSVDGDFNIYMNDDPKPLCTTSEAAPAICEPTRTRSLTRNDRLRIDLAVEPLVQLAFDLLVNVDIHDAQKLPGYDPKGKRPRDPGP